MLREAKPEELNEILELYIYLHEDGAANWLEENYTPSR